MIEEGDKSIKRAEGEESELDFMEIVRKLWPERKTLLKAAIWGAVVGLVIVFNSSKSYNVEVTLAPERSGRSTNSSLASLASMMGAGNLAMMSGGSDVDALNVLFYPQIVESTPFILELLDSRVTTKEKEEVMTFAEYLDSKTPSLIGYVFRIPGLAIGWVKSLFADDEKEDEDEDAPLNTFKLTKKQASMVKALRSAVTADVDNKTGLTTVSVTLDDPMVTAIIADSVLSKLKKHITAYRVSKAQQDCEYLENLYKQRQAEYYEALQNYAEYVDANKSVILLSALTERERLQNDMNLAFQVYSQVATQLQVARAKVQEEKPVFAVVEPASVPLKPSGRSSKTTLLGIIFLAVAGTGAWILFGRDFYANLKKELTA